MFGRPASGHPIALRMLWKFGPCAEEPVEMLGKTLGHYRIVGELGAGGMGVVYRAQDLHLDRPVALKVLPPGKITDINAARRLAQEARSASALNHPNIVTIYDIGREGETDFIAMEYVEGRTLDQLVPRNGLRLGETLKYAIQIADALARAHQAGIVHRDLKPSNIMVDAHGVVRLLDFGLAKLADEGTAANEEATQTALTQTGAVLGTAAYMSPEQVQGRHVDARSDIFSFGAVLYEMATGRRAFQGDSALATVAAVTDREPAPVGGDVPRDLERIMTRALRKDPARRFQSMADVKVELDDLKEASDSGKLLASPPARTRAARRVWIGAAGLGVAAAAVAVVLWLMNTAPEVFELKAERVTFDRGVTATPAISPDGKLIAYASDRSGEGSLDIFVQQLAGGQPERLTRDRADDYAPSFSPDGARIVFRSERDGGGLYIVDVIGGAPERKLVSGGRYPSFSPDGSAIAYTEDPLVGVPPGYRMRLVSPKGGQPRPFQPSFRALPGSFDASLSWSDDGRRIAFPGVGPDQKYDWWVAPLDGGPPVATGAWNTLRLSRLPLLELAGLCGQHLYFFRGSIVEGLHLFRVPIAAGSWKIAGPAQQLTSGGGTYLGFSMSATGQMVFSHVNLAEDFVGFPIPKTTGSEASPPATKLTADATIKGNLSLSRDGSRAAYQAYVSWESGRIEIRVRDLPSGHESVYASESLPATALPVISPDGSLLAYAELVDGRFVSFIGPSESLPGSPVCEDCQVFDFSSNSREALIVYGSNRLVKRNTSTGAEAPVLTLPSGQLLDVNVSPDDRWIAFVIAEPDRPVETYVAPAAEAASVRESWLRVPLDRSYVQLRWLRGVSGSKTTRKLGPIWSAKGDELYYISDRDGRFCVWAQQLDPETRALKGLPYPLQHLHEQPTSAAMLGGKMFLARSRDRIFISGWTLSSNLWTARVGSSR